MLSGVFSVAQALWWTRRCRRTAGEFARLQDQRGEDGVSWLPTSPFKLIKCLVEEILRFPVSLSFRFVCILQTRSWWQSPIVVDELMTKQLSIPEVLLSERKTLDPEGPHPPLHCSRSLGSLQIPSAGACNRWLKPTLGRTQKVNPSLTPKPWGGHQNVPC